MEEVPGRKSGNRTDIGPDMSDEGKKKIERRIKLTNRDLDIIEFCLEMYFSDIESIYSRFFRTLHSGEKSISMHWARERVGLLKKYGYLKSRRISFEGNAYYLTTELGRLALDSIRGEKKYLKVVREIDVRYFEHHRLVLKCRTHLETTAEVSNWISDRTLKSCGEDFYGLPRSLKPDAIYTNRLGERIALELERTSKEPRRHNEKIRKYVEIARRRGDERPFERVLFIATKNSIFKSLTDKTSVYGERISVRMLDALLQLETQ